MFLIFSEIKRKKNNNPSLFFILQPYDPKICPVALSCCSRVFVGAPTWQSSPHPAVSSCCSCGGLGLAGPQTRGSRLGTVCGSSTSSRRRLRLLGPWRERPPGPGSGRPAPSTSSRWKRRDRLQSGGRGGGGRGRQTPGHLWQRTPSSGDEW